MSEEKGNSKSPLYLVRNSWESTCPKCEVPMSAPLPSRAADIVGVRVECPKCNASSKIIEVLGGDLFLYFIGFEKTPTDVKRFKLMREFFPIMLSATLDPSGNDVVLIKPIVDSAWAVTEAAVEKWLEYEKQYEEKFGSVD